MTDTLQRLVNLPRAREHMVRAGVDGMIACLPHNVYYFSSYWGLLMSAAHFDAAFFAVLPAREDLPAALVLPSMELRRLETQGGTWMPETFIYTSPEDDEDPISIDGKPYGGWPQHPGSRLTDLEERWVAVTQQQVGKVAGNSRGALARAVRVAGLENGNWVTDDARVADWLASAGVKHNECRTDVDLFRRIRMVKTPAEIELMRAAGEINENAARSAVGAFREGAQWHEIERAYATAMAAAGGDASYLICGAGGPPSGRLRHGEPMFIDALGTYARYHGDFGRCVVLGEPNDLMLQRHAALCAGFDALRPLLRPGIGYQALADTAVQAIRKSGLPEFVYATPHSVGLEHTDDPRPVGGQQGMTADVVLEAGMVINVDLPFTEIGWGSVHIEDSILITDDGFELLTSSDLGIIAV